MWTGKGELEKAVRSAKERDVEKIASKCNQPSVRGRVDKKTEPDRPKLYDNHMACNKTTRHMLSASDDHRKPAPHAAIRHQHSAILTRQRGPNRIGYG